MFMACKEEREREEKERENERTKMPTSFL